MELMAVVAILGVLAAVAVGAYTRQVRRAHKAQVIANISQISLRQKSFLSVAGHYASSSACEGPDCIYPLGDDVTAAASQEITWDIEDAAYTAAVASDGEYMRGGGALHGFDALRFLPEGGHSRCGYGTISGHGTEAMVPENSDEPPSDEIATLVFPADDDAEAYYARDWFYAYALCDFDGDDVFWAFSTAHYTADVNSTDVDTTYLENE